MWSQPNQAAKKLKPEARWKSEPESLVPLYQAFESSALISGPTRVLVSQEGESRYKWVFTEALGVGKGEKRRVLGFHYLARAV
jgi:hypothetical protein